jgi:hypothetical protein
MTYDDPGHDYFNYPPHEPPLYLSDRGKLIFKTIQETLVNQAKSDFSRKGKGYLCFLPDYKTDVEMLIHIGELTRAIEFVLPKEEKDDATTDSPDS